MIENFNAKRKIDYYQWDKKDREFQGEKKDREFQCAKEDREFLCEGEDILEPLYSFSSDCLNNCHG